MAHNINTYIGREAAWHDLGTVTGEFETWKSILAHGGLDFTVIKQQLLSPQSDITDMDVIEAYGMFRSDNGVFLGTVGKDYEPIQHSQGFELVDALVASADRAHYETAGVLGDGEKVWGLADLGRAISVGDDIQEGYLLFSTSHDGSMSHTYRTCLTRVVCQNTLTIALGERAKGLFRVRHTKSAQDKIASAHAALETVSGDLRTVEAKLNMLAARKVVKETMTSILDRLFPPAKDAKGVDKETTRRDNILSAVLANYESNDRNAFPQQRGTLYNLLNAVTEYTDHERSSRGDRRSESALFGTGDQLKTKALELCYEAVATAPAMERSTIYATRPMGSDFGDDYSSLLDSIVSAA